MLYQPENDSPFDDTYSLWLADHRKTAHTYCLAPLADATLDEFVSVAYALRDQLIYADDDFLAVFISDCEEELDRRWHRRYHAH